jgi:hypothetical protein
MLKRIAITLTLAAMLAIPASARVRWGVSVGVGAPAYYGPSYYYAPAPVYYYPRYYYPRGYAYYGPRYYRHRYHGYYGGYFYYGR